MTCCLTVVPRMGTIDHVPKAPDGKSKHFFLFCGKVDALSSDEFTERRSLLCSVYIAHGIT